MPYARNSIDGTRVYFEDDGGGGTPVVFYGGLVDSVEAVRLSPIAQALPADQFRLVYVDHRGVGRSDKPHERAAYAMWLRVADAVSVLDAMRVRRAHFVGTSYGGRLCFGIGKHAPDRVLSLVIGGQQRDPECGVRPPSRSRPHRRTPGTGPSVGCRTPHTRRRCPRGLRCPSGRRYLDARTRRRTGMCSYEADGKEQQCRCRSKPVRPCWCARRSIHPRP
jgi:pimeloyl-ACP methyl ester carboxylesterase